MTMTMTTTTTTTTTTILGRAVACEEVACRAHDDSSYPFMLAEEDR